MEGLKTKFVKGYSFLTKVRKARVIGIAEKHDWNEMIEQDNIGMISFFKKIQGFECRINVYLTTMSVTTYIKHPKKGRGQLYRKAVDPKQLNKIFKNPRQHTGIGYYTKPKKKKK